MTGRGIQAILSAPVNYSLEVFDDGRWSACSRRRQESQKNFIHSFIVLPFVASFAILMLLLASTSGYAQRDDPETTAECGFRIHDKWKSQRDQSHESERQALREAEEAYQHNRRQIEEREYDDPDQQVKDLESLELDYEIVKNRIKNTHHRERVRQLESELDELNNSCQQPPVESESEPQQDYQDGSEGGGADEDSFTHPPIELPYDLPTVPITKVTMVNLGTSPTSCHSDGDGGVTCEQDAG